MVATIRALVAGHHRSAPAARTFTNFARSLSSHSTGVAPPDEDGWARLLADPGPRGVTIRGAGASYSDAALNSGGTVATAPGNHHIRDFDGDTGVIDVDAGLSLADLCAVTIPRGWIPPVLPGTAQVTVGGALAADVHGKNHERRGSFGQHVLDARVMTPAAGLLQIGPRQDPAAFWATAGGLGLTGVVLTARLQLRRITTGWLMTQDQPCMDLDSVLDSMTASGRTDEHVAAWIDGLATGSVTGRGIVSTGRHLAADELPSRLARCPLTYRPVASSPLLPASVRLLRPPLVRALNTARFTAARRARAARIKDVSTALQPLDAGFDWSAVYGRRGLIQYQFSVPDGQEPVLARSLEHLTAAGCPPLLVVLKRLGAADPGPLSFPSPGWTIALDLPTAAASAAAAVLDHLDDLVVSAGGRINLVKDTRLARDMVPAMYPRLDEWRQVRRALDPSGVLTSDLDRRLDLSGRWGGDRRC